MSFSFGSATTTTASTFGTNTPSTGFSFGSSGDAKPLFGGTGAAQADNKPAFNFASTTTSAPAFGGFSFGSKTTTAAPSMFGTPATTTTSAFGASKPLSFGGLQSPPNQTVGSPGFGQAAGQTAAQNLSFGATTNQAPPAFGTPTAQASVPIAASSPAFGSPAAGGAFGAAATTTASTGFFSTPASGFSAPPNQTTASPQTSQPLFGLKPAAPATSAPAFGQTSTFGKPATGFSFGQAATAATTAPTFGTATPAFGQPQTQQTATPQATLSFGATSAPSTVGASSTVGTLGTSGGLGTGTLGTSGGLGTGTLGTSGGLGTGTLGTSGGLGTSTLGTTGTTGGLGTTNALGTTGGVGTAGTSGFSFGATSTASSQPSGLNFGSNTAFGSTQSTPSSQPAAAPSLSFGAPTSSALPGLSLASAQPTTGISGTPVASQSTGVSFGANTTQASGIKFGAPTSTAATSASTGITFGAGAAVSSAAPTSAPLSFAAPAPPSTAAPAASVAASITATTSASTGISLLGKSTAATTLPTLTAVTTTTASGPPQPISSVTFSQLEESINKWTIELEEQENTFINQATQINAWDRLLIANGEKIVELNDAVETVRSEQQNLEHELDFVLAQQKELEELLAPMEGELQTPTDRPKDPQRDHMYSLAENLDTQLRQMSEDLKEVIEHLNETNRSQDSNDPIVQIGRILNAHMSSMQWIDNSIAQISTKLDQLKATHDTLRRDNERSFQLTYN